MRINLTELSVKFGTTERNGVVTPNDTFRLTMNNGATRENYKREQEPYSFSTIICEREYEHFCKCLRGQAEFYPWFDDLSYLTRPHSHGVWAMHLGERIHERYDYVFPGPELADVIETGNDWVLTPEILADWKARFSPVVEWDYRDIYLKYPETRPLRPVIDRDLADPRQTRLQYCLDGLQTIAENHSNGLPSIVMISLDSYSKDLDKGPASYYWEIYAGLNAREHHRENLVMNGGIIAHPKYENGVKRTDCWEYSTHT